MEGKSSARREPAAHNAWWRAPSEDYWQALLTQGEVVSGPVPPLDPPEALYAGLTESDLAETVPCTPDAEDAVDSVWELARQLMDRAEVLTLRVVGANRGGLVVDWQGMQGFVPASHLRDVPRTRDAQDRVAELSHRVGASLDLRLIQVDEAQSRLVFSERASGSPPASSATLLSSLRPGDVCWGRVVNLTAFGAFVDLGGVEGLIHVSEISWDRLAHPGDALQAGAQIQVQVLGVNPDEGRIALSMKRLRPNPWAHVEKRYQVGQIVEGTITNVVTFGAFVRLEEGLEGLIHVSELAEGSFLHPRNVISEGEQVRVRVLSVDTEKQRMALSLRQMRETEHGE